MRRSWNLGRLAAAGLLIALSSAVATAQDKEEKEPKPPERANEPASRSDQGWWLQMHDSFLKRAREGPVDLLFLGDSIMQGWASRDAKGKGPVEVWDRYYAPRNAANFGIGGDRTQHILWRIERGELDEIRPKVVVLMIGTNNLGSNTAAEIADGIVEIVKRIREKRPEAKILLLALFPRGHEPDEKRERLQAVNARIRPLDDGRMVKYLDLGRAFLEEDGTISRDVMPDYLHLTRKGYRIWADAMEPTLWSMLEGN